MNSRAMSSKMEKEQRTFSELELGGEKPEEGSLAQGEREKEEKIIIVPVCRESL